MKEHWPLVHRKQLHPIPVHICMCCCCSDRGQSTSNHQCLWGMGLRLRNHAQSNRQNSDTVPKHTLRYQSSSLGKHRRRRMLSKWWPQPKLLSTPQRRSSSPHQNQEHKSTPHFCKHRGESTGSGMVSRMNSRHPQSPQHTDRYVPHRCHDLNSLWGKS